MVFYPPATRTLRAGDASGARTVGHVESIGDGGAACRGSGEGRVGLDVAWKGALPAGRAPGICTPPRRDARGGRHRRAQQRGRHSGRSVTAGRRGRQGIAVVAGAVRVCRRLLGVPCAEREHQGCPKRPQLQKACAADRARKRPQLSPCPRGRYFDSAAEGAPDQTTPPPARPILLGVYSAQRHAQSGMKGPSNFITVEILCRVLECTSVARPVFELSGSQLHSIQWFGVRFM